jgi:hypothetical protein
LGPLLRILWLPDLLIQPCGHLGLGAGALAEGLFTEDAGRRLSVGAESRREVTRFGGHNLRLKDVPTWVAVPQIIDRWMDEELGVVALALWALEEICEG